MKLCYFVLIFLFIQRFNLGVFEYVLSQDFKIFINLEEENVYICFFYGVMFIFSVIELYLYFILNNIFLGECKIFEYYVFFFYYIE